MPTRSHPRPSTTSAGRAGTERAPRRGGRELRGVHAPLPGVVGASPTIRWLLSTVSRRRWSSTTTTCTTTGTSRSSWVRGHAQARTGGRSGCSAGSRATGSTSTSATSRPAELASSELYAAGARGGRRLRGAARSSPPTTTAGTRACAGATPATSGRSKLIVARRPHGPGARRGRARDHRRPRRGTGWSSEAERRVRPPRHRRLGPGAPDAGPQLPRELERGGLRRRAGAGAAARLGREAAPRRRLRPLARVPQSRSSGWAGCSSEVGSRRVRAPASITLLSGDVHHAYLAEVGFPQRTRA